MTSSLKRKSLCKPEPGVPLAPYDVAAVRGRNKNKAHSQLLDLFVNSGLSKTELARMLKKRPEQITRWLGGPGNLKLDTLSDLAFAISGKFVEVRFSDELSKAKSNQCPPEWWKPIYDQELSYSADSMLWSSVVEGAEEAPKKLVQISAVPKTGRKYERFAS